MAEEGTEGFGEAGVGPFQFGEEEMEELAKLGLGAGEFLGQVLVKVGEGAQGGVVLEGGGQGLDGELLAEEEGSGCPSGPEGRRSEAELGFQTPTSRFMGALRPKQLIGIVGRPEEHSCRGSQAHTHAVLPPPPLSPYLQDKHES